MNIMGKEKAMEIALHLNTEEAAFERVPAEVFRYSVVEVNGALGYFAVMVADGEGELGYL